MNDVFSILHLHTAGAIGGDFIVSAVEQGLAPQIEGNGVILLEHCDEADIPPTFGPAHAEFAKIGDAETVLVSNDIQNDHVLVKAFNGLGAYDVFSVSMHEGHPQHAGEASLRIGNLLGQLSFPMAQSVGHSLCQIAENVMASFPARIVPNSVFAAVDHALSTHRGRPLNFRMHAPSSAVGGSGK